MLKDLDDYHRKTLDARIREINAIHDEINKGGSVYKIHKLYDKLSDTWLSVLSNQKSKLVPDASERKEKADCMRDIMLAHIQYKFEYKDISFRNATCDNLMKDSRLYNETKAGLDESREDYQAAPGRWFGAIAVNRTSHKYYSYSVNQRDAFSAAADALKSCTSLTHNTRPEWNQPLDCKITMALRNECGAFTVSEDGQNSVTSASKDFARAKSNSLKSCSEKYGVNCRNVLAVCSKGPNN